MIYGIKVHGTINATMQDFLIQKINMCEESKRVKAILLDVNSSGGSASASEMIYNRVREFSVRKPVFTIVTGMATSGAYMIISPSKKIFSIKTAVIGSIGVYSIMPDISGLLEKIGVRIRQERMGKYKNASNPFEAPDEEAEKSQKQIVKGIYEMFLNMVTENRKLEKDQVNIIRESDIFLAERAVEIGLVDRVATFEESVSEIMKTLGENRRPIFEIPKSPLFYRVLDRFV